MSANTDHEDDEENAGVHTVTASSDLLRDLSWRHVRWIIAPLTALAVVFVLPDGGLWTLLRWVIGLPAAGALAYHFLVLNGVDMEVERRERSGHLPTRGETPRKPGAAEPKR